MSSAESSCAAKRLHRRGRPVALLLVIATIVVLGGPGRSASGAPPPPCFAQPPVNTRAPLITPSGAVVVGTRLSTSNGTWTSCGSTISGWTYQWTRDGANISGQAAASYTTVSTDAGHVIRSTVIACNADGCSDPPVASSNSAAPVCGTGQIVNASPPVLSGSTAIGGVLTVSQGSWNPPGQTFTYQWFRDDAVISGATNSTYTTAAVDGAAIIYARVTASAPCAAAATATSNSLQIADDGDTMGDLDADQRPNGPDDSPHQPAGPSPVSGPQPMSPLGPAPVNSYSVTLWDGAATDTPDSLNVISSTATGTAGLTGYVEDDSASTPVPAATVTMTDTTNPSTVVTTTTDDDGSFAFINLPPETYTLTIDASGYGRYTITNDSYASDQTYERTVSLNTTTQTYDAIDQAPADTSIAAADLPGTAYPERRVPPSITVKRLDLYPRSAGVLFCTAVNQNQTNAPITRYSTPFYVLHVAHAEIGGLHPNATLLKAFMALALNFAWFHKTKGGSYDVVNASDLYAGQCFYPAADKISQSTYDSWRDLLSEVAKNRIVDGSGHLGQTQYAAGTPPGRCVDPLSPAHNSAAQASQFGMLAHSLPTEPYVGGAHCQITDWKTLALYFYPTNWNFPSTTSAYRSRRPPVPTHTWTMSNGHATFTFAARTYGKPVAWSYKLQRRTSDGQWHTFYTASWDPTARAVRETYTLTPPSTCMRYRVKAVNPVGESLPAPFNGTSGISSGGSCANPVG